jgi:hypothetical protein
LRSELIDDDAVISDVELAFVSTVAGVLDATVSVRVTDDDEDFPAIHQMTQMIIMTSITLTTAFPVFDILILNYANKSFGKLRDVWSLNQGLVDMHYSIF